METILNLKCCFYHTLYAHFCSVDSELLKRKDVEMAEQICFGVDFFVLYVCKICGGKFSGETRDDMLDHMPVEHNVEAKCKPGSDNILIRYHCGYCPFDCAIIFDVIRHVQNQALFRAT